MEHLINSLPALLRAAGEVDEVAVTVAQSAWNHVAGEKLRQQTVVTHFQKQKLTVAVPDSIWQRQLESMGAQLVFRLNALLGTGSIKFIEFRVDVAALEKLAPKIAPSNAKEPEPLPVELLTAASAIQSPQLRRAFLGAASSSLQHRRLRRQ